nr:hypothetical protein [Tanacetum cinerariifolium]
GFYHEFAMGCSVHGGYKLSNESLLERLPCNIFITNFSVHLSAKELWNTCAQYGTVQDVYIPKKLSKQGKPFAFVHFNKINDVDMLIRNLRSNWLGNFRIYANVARFTRESKPKSFSQISAHKEPMHVNSKSKEPLHGFGYTPSFAKVVKRNEVQECHDTLVMVLERGSLNYRGDHVIVGCVKDFKNLLNIHNVYFGEDRVVWIDVEGMPLQAWSHATFNRITSKWGKLVYMDDTNASNKYNMRLYVKTGVHHLIAESFKVILEGKVSAVRVKEVTGWVPDFGDDDIAQSEDGSDNNSVGIHKWEEENDGHVIPYSFQSIVNEYNIVKNSLDHVENSPGKILANSLRLVIDKLINHEQFAFIKDRVVWIDVEGMPLQAWSHATFNTITSKWGKLVYMDDTNASNNYIMRLCVKTRVHHLIAESFKVILEGKVPVVRVKEVIGWDHIDYILGKFEFGSKWRGWIHGCLHSSKALVLVNGSPTEEFLFHRGLRQGDPLSSFLFILVMESLHVAFQRLIDKVSGLVIILYGLGVHSLDIQSMANSFGCLASNLTVDTKRPCTKEDTVSLTVEADPTIRLRRENQDMFWRIIIFNKKVNTVRVNDSTARDTAVVSGNMRREKEYKEKGVIDSGCSRHMTRKKCYLTDFEAYDGGFVSFGDGKGRISGKGKIKIGKLDFDDVYFCEELKYNLFSVSQL